MAADPRLLDRVLPPTDEGRSHGLIRDALGPTAGPTAEKVWLETTEKVAGAGASGSVPGAVAAVAVDGVNEQLGRYEELQGVRDGDLLETADGAITVRLSQVDAVAHIGAFTPAAPIAAAAMPVTAAAVGAWTSLRSKALEDELAGGRSEGSPTRYLLQTPDRFNEQRVQPLAHRIGGPIGDAVSVVGDEVASGDRWVEQSIDRQGQLQREAIEKVPHLDEVLSLPRRAVETPRHVIERARHHG